MTNLAQQSWIYGVWTSIKWFFLFMSLFFITWQSSNDKKSNNCPPVVVRIDVKLVAINERGRGRGSGNLIFNVLYFWHRLCKHQWLLLLIVYFMLLFTISLRTISHYFALFRTISHYFALFRTISNYFALLSTSQHYFIMLCIL